jgi:outer membrane receptor protein involved in Fe transport
MKSLVAVIAIAVSSSVASAQQGAAISGQVVDATGAPLANVIASIVDIGIQTRTDSNGRFSFSNIPVSEYTLTFRRTGMSATSISHVRPGDALSNVVLTASPVVISPVTVTAARGATEIGSSVLPVSQINEEGLRRDGSISLAHSLVRLPGVRSVGTGLQIGKPMIRGFYGARVLSLQNGSRLEDYSWSEEDAPSVDPRLAQRVEVVRGPASVLYGSDALGGVVNVIPQDLPTATDNQGFKRFGGELYGASVNKEVGGTLNAEGAKGRLGWRAIGIGRLAQSYETPDGEVEHTGFFSVNGEAAAGIRGTKSNTTLRFSHYGGEFKLLEARGPGSGGEVEGEEEEGPERKLADERLQLVNDYSFHSFRLQTKAQFQRHSLVEMSDDLCLIDPVACASLPPNAPKEQTAFDLLLNTGTLDVLAHHNIGSKVHGVVGLSGMFQGNDSRGPLFLIPDATTQSGAAFLFEEAELGRVGLAFGARFDGRKLSANANNALALTTDDDRDWSEPSANAGLVLHLTPQLALTGNAGLAWRAPTLFELYANGPHLAEGRYEIGDATLDAEHARNLDAGIRWTSARVRLDANAFRNKVDDFIYITPTSQFINGLRVFRHVHGDAVLAGGEAAAEVEVASGLLLRTRHDFVRGTNEDTDDPLPLMPAPRTAGGAEYHFTSSTFGDASIAGEVENVRRQKRPNDLDVVTAGYTLLNFDIAFNHSLFGRQGRIDIGIRNAANRKYRDFMSRYKEFALEPGRNVLVKVSTGL